MLRKGYWFAIAAAMILASNGVAAQEQTEFKVWLQQISRSSAVAPVGRVASKPINIMPGNFDKPNRTDAVIITEAGTKYCKGPHFKQCDAITTMPLKTTVAVNETDGRAVLLRMEGPTLFQKCTLDWSRGSASVDCRNISFDALSKYARKQANGVVMIDGTDGQYVCQSISKEPSCHLVALDKNGTPPEKRKKGEAPRFRPDRNTVCHFKNESEGFDCKPSEKVSEAAETEEAVAEVSAPSMLPVVINFEIEDDDMPHIPLDGVTITGQYGDSWNGTYGQYWTDLIWEYVGVPAQEAGQFTYCMNACYSGYQGSLTTCLSAFGVGFALGTAACGGNIGCGEALGSLMMSTCMLGREIEYGNCKQGCINNYGT